MHEQCPIELERSVNDTVPVMGECMGTVQKSMPFEGGNNGPESTSSVPHLAK
jgi:hypothetical protein